MIIRPYSETCYPLRLYMYNIQEEVLGNGTVSRQHVTHRNLRLLSLQIISYPYEG